MRGRRRRMPPIRLRSRLGRITRPPATSMPRTSSAGTARCPSLAMRPRTRRAMLMAALVMVILCRAGL
eukprot:6020010-Pyramimonas_sp.AAC.1